MEELDYQTAGRGNTQVLCALRQVGCDAWCSGGSEINMLCDQHRIDSTKLLGTEIVGHTVQMRLLPSQLAACDDPLGLDRGDRVTVYGLTSAAGRLLNAKCGKLGGPLGAMKAGCYPVFFKGSKGFKQIKPCNLRSIADPGRAAAAGHEVDALQTVVMKGRAATNGTCVTLRYVLNTARIVNAFPVFSCTARFMDDHLYCGSDGHWYISDSQSMMNGWNRGTIVSASKSPSPLGLQWKAPNAAYTKHVIDPAITLDALTWRTGSPPAPWIYRDATITSFNAASHEHTLVFRDLAQTTLHLRLDHVQFLDWDVLPRRRAAMLAPRAAVTVMMVMDRVLLEVQLQQLVDFTVGRETQAISFPPETPALRVFVYIMQSSTKDCADIFRENVWPSVVARRAA